MKLCQSTMFIGLVQAFSVFVFTFLLFFGFSRSMELLSFRLDNPPLTITLLIIMFIFAVLSYVLIIFAYPTYLFTQKKAAEGMQIIAFTATSLALLFIITVTCSYLLTGNRTSIYQSPSPFDLSREDAIKNAEKSKLDSEEARLEYEKLQNTDYPMSPGEPMVQDVGKIYPYSIDINTGEKTPL